MSNSKVGSRATSFYHEERFPLRVCVSTLLQDCMTPLTRGYSAVQISDFTTFKQICMFACVPSLKNKIVAI